MIRIPNKYLGHFSWLNILVGSFFLIGGTIGGVLFYTFNPSVNFSVTVWDYVFGIFLSLLTLVSGYTILVSKRKVRHKEMIAWPAIILGFVCFVSFLIPGNPQLTKTSVLVSMLLTTPLYLFLTISGFIFRKIRY